MRVLAVVVIRPGNHGDAAATAVGDVGGGGGGERAGAERGRRTGESEGWGWGLHRFGVFDPLGSNRCASGV